MKDEDFDQLMNTWADDASESAPAMRPSADMVRMVEAMQLRQPAPWFQVSWVRYSTAFASLVVIVFLLWSNLIGSPGQTPIGLREGVASVSDLVLAEGTEVRKSDIFEELMFQYQKENSRVVNGVDLRSSLPETISLSSGDNYRLFLETSGEHHVYVFQLTSSEDLVTIYPNESFSDTPNPLIQGYEYYLPDEPKWMYLPDNTGLESLYVIASKAPIPVLDGLIYGGEESSDGSNRESPLDKLMASIQAIEDGIFESAETWLFVFNRED